MKNEEKLQKIIDDISKNEIEKLRKNYSQDKIVDKYLFKISKKIFNKLIFPYFRFELLLHMVDDIINNHTYYNMCKKDLKKVKLIFNQLQKICLYLNIILDEFNKMLFYINKRTN